ncbi:MAG: helix-turn-helix transcriptional regulator [Solirubrobacteraceae bacterium]|nr:helix-turn-helix transcriptional regulator [Solirubrobacteraceae bacterium]
MAWKISFNRQTLCLCEVCTLWWARVRARPTNPVSPFIANRSWGGATVTALGSKRHPYNQWSPDARALDRVGDKWTLLIIRDLADGPRRFVDLQRTLPGISTEQLRSRLNRMVDDELLTRSRYREVPPRVDYELTEEARALLPAIAAIARWGYKHAWTDALAGEHVDIGAILRATAGGIVTDKIGDVDCVILDETHGEVRWRVALADGGARLVREFDAEAASALIGNEAAWRAALGPAGDHAALQVAGDRELALEVLAQISAAGPVSAPVQPA